MQVMVLDWRQAAGAQRRGDGVTLAWMKLNESGLQEVTSPLLIFSSPKEGQRSQRLFQRHLETCLKFIDNIDWKDQPVLRPTFIFFSPCFLSFLLIFSGFSSPFVSSLDSFLSPPPTPPHSHRGSEERHSGASPSSELQTQQAQLTLQGQRDDGREGKATTLIRSPATSELRCSQHKF